MSMKKQQEPIKINPETQVVVFYHKNCNDGFVAGFTWWLAHRFDERTHQYIPLQYKEPVADLTGKEVVMLDVTVLPAQFQEIKRSAKSLFVLDHHESAMIDYEQAQIQGKYGFNKCRCSDSDQEKTFLFTSERKNPSCAIFSKQKASGALMTFQHLEKKLKEDNRWLSAWVIDILQYICERTSDRDLWKFEYSNSKALYEVLCTFNYDFQKLHEFIITGHQAIMSAVEKAQIRVDMRDEFAKLYAGKAETIKFLGYEIPAINCPANIASEVGDTLNAMNDIPFALMYILNSEKVFCSLRSSKNNSKAVNVFQLAKNFGGGGHANAAGFITDPETLLSIIRSEM